MTQIITEVLTGQTAASPDELRALATRCETVPTKGLPWLEAADLNARICAALLPGWDYVPERPAVPEERAPDGPRGRRGKVIKPGVSALAAQIKRTTRTTYPKGEPSYSHESAPAPKVISDIAQVWGLLHGRLLLALYDVGDGFASARVAHAGQPAIYAEGCGATAILSLCAAILRCEANAREARHA